jgi:hypothetical protein
MEATKIKQNMDDIVDVYDKYKKYPSEANKFIHKSQIYNFVNSLDSDDDLININKYFCANKVVEIAKGFGELAIIGGLGYLSDEFFNSSPYGILTACTFGVIELTRRTSKAMKYLSVEDKIDTEYVRQNNSLFFKNI